MPPPADSSAISAVLDRRGPSAYESRSFRERNEDQAMSRRCELTGKGPMVGHNVSHANNKTKRVFRPNLQTVSLASEALGQKVKLRISMNALRSVDRTGGLDPFLLKAKDTLLSVRALRLKRLIAKKQSAQAAAA